MRLIDADALKKAIKELPNDNPSYYYTGYLLDRECVLDEIDNAPTVETKFELKTENGITYPKALDNMTFSHILSVEERQNIIQAYMLGANANARPQGEWVRKEDLLHYIATQYSEHNELVPTWLKIGDWQGGKEE